MALGCSAPNAICLVDLAIADDGLDWPRLASTGLLSPVALVILLVTRSVLLITGNISEKFLGGGNQNTHRVSNKLPPSQPRKS